MNYYLPQIVIFKKIKLIASLLTLICTANISFAQLVSNEYTPVTTANGLAPILSASDETCVVIIDEGCVDNLSNIDGNLNDAATINALLLSSDWIEVQFNETAPAGSYAGFVIESGISLVAGLSIEVSDGTNSETLDGSNLLSLGLTGSADRVGFYTTIDFDRIRITYGGLAGSLDVYYAEVMKFEELRTIPCNNEYTLIGRTIDPVYVNPDETGFTGISTGTISDIENAVDDDPNTSASIDFGVALSGSVTFSIKRGDGGSYGSNQYVGFDIGFSSGLLDLSLLSNLTIETYNNGNPTGDAASGNQLVLNVGLISGSTRGSVGLVSTAAYDEVIITINNGLSLLQQVDIYGMVIKCFQNTSITCNDNFTNIDESEHPFYIEESSITGLIGANNSIVDVSNIIDGSSTTAATINQSVGVGSTATIRIKKALGVIDEGTFVGFELESSGALLTLQLLNALRIRTFDGTTEIDDSDDGNIAIDATISGGANRQVIGIISSGDIDAIELTLTQGVSVDLGSTNIYNLVVKCFGSDPSVTCNNSFSYIDDSNSPYYFDGSKTGVTGTLGASNTIEDLGNILDGSSTSFATVNQTLSGNSAATIAIKKELSEIPTGRFVGFEIESSSSLLDLELLGSISIETFNNGTPVDESSSDDLAVDVGLSSGSSRSVVGLVTSGPIDEIVLTLDEGLLSLGLGETYIYNLVVKCFQEGSAIPCNNQFTIIDESNDPYYLDGSTTGVTGTLGLNNSILNAGNILDGNGSTSATVNQTAGINSTATIGIKKAGNPILAGTFIGFEIESGVSIVDAELLSTISIETFDANGNSTGSTSNEDIILTGNIVGGANRRVVGMIPQSDFNEVVITFDETVGVSLGETEIYNLVVKCFTAGPSFTSCNSSSGPAKNTNIQWTTPEYPLVISQDNTGFGGLLTLGEILEPNNAIDNNSTNYTTIQTVASASGSAYYSVKDVESDYDGGLYVGFDIGRPSLASVSALSEFTIRTYLNGSPTGDVLSDADLLTAPTGLLNGEIRQVLGFVTTQDFDEIQLEIDDNVSLLSNTRIYNVVLKQLCEGDMDDCTNAPEIVSNPDYPVYIDWEQTGVSGLSTCVGCAINNTENVVDNDPDNYAELTITADVGSEISLAVKDEITTYGANTFAGFEIATNSLLSANLIGSATIQLFNNGSQVQSGSGNALLVGATTSLLGNDLHRQPVGIISNQPYDEVKISFEKLLSADLGEIRIYNALFSTTCEATITCNQSFYLNQTEFPAFINSERTGTSGIADVSSLVNDPWNVVSSSTSDYAEMILDVGVAGSVSLSVVDALAEYPAGTVAGFTIENFNTLLVELDLFDAVTISTYLNGSFQQSATGSQLINLGLLGLPVLGGSGGIYNVGFETSLPFDEVQITLTGIANVNLLNETRVYGAYVDTRFVMSGEFACPQYDLDPDFNATLINVPVSGNVNTNDEVPSGTTYGTPIPISGNPSGAALNMNSNGSYNFQTPNPGVYNYNIPVCIPDGPDPCPTTLLTITVEDKNDNNTDPIANHDYGSGVANETITLNSLSNDSPGSDGIPLDPGSVSIINGPDNGTANVLPNGSIEYTPNAGFVGTDVLTYQVCDEDNNCASAQQFFSVVPPGGENTTEAADDFAYIQPWQTASGNLGANDTDPEGDSQSISSGTFNLSGGTLVISNSSGEYTFTPDENFYGTTSYQYTICDDGTPSSCADATLYILVGPPDPILNPDFNATLINVPVDGDVSTNDDAPPGAEYTSATPDGSNPAGGTLMLTPDGSYTFTATNPGIYNYTVTICITGDDPCTIEETTLLTITVDDPDDSNTDPIANHDYGSTKEGQSIVLNSLSNDSPGSDGHPLNSASASVTSGPNNGSISVNSSTGEITYTPDAGFTGTDVLTYQVCDDNGSCSSAQQFFTVLPLDSGNTTEAADDFVYIQPGDTGTGNLGANDTDPEGNSQTIATGTSTQTGVGTLEITSNSGDFVFTPEPGFSGPAEFTYTTCDNGDPQACATATLHVLVGPTYPDLTPGIQVNTATINEGGSVSITYNYTNLGPENSRGTEIEFRIFKVNTFGSISIDPPPSGWSLTDEGNYYSLKSTNIILVGSENRISFNGIFVHDGDDENAVIELVTDIIIGAGGEINGDNNIDNQLIQIN